MEVPVVTEKDYKLLMELDPELSIAYSDSKEWSYIRTQMLARADIQEDQKELAWNAAHFLYKDEDGILTEVWAVSGRAIGAYTPARHLL